MSGFIDEHQGGRTLRLPQVDRVRAAVLLIGALLALVAGAPPALAARSDAKAIWGPVSVDGRSLFPVYHRLGVGIFQMTLNWASVAPTEPEHPTNPNDPAYRWPTDISYAIQHAAHYHMKVLLQVEFTPSWANGDQQMNYPPTDVSSWADFVTAAARRYPAVHLWMIWGEPNRQPQFGTLVSADPDATTLTPEQAAAPQFYAQMLDASYAVLKAANPNNLVIGGSTYTTGDLSTEQWIENMRLPDGQPPRMDLYAHNPFSWRPPDLSNPPSPDGQVDFSDLSRLSQLVQSNLAAPGRQIKLFLSEWTIPTAPGDQEFDYYETPDVQAQWITDAWRIVRSSSFIYALGWVHLYDDPPGGSNGGLLYSDWFPKPGYYAFRDG
jgi:hypothetical protein